MTPTLCWVFLLALVGRAASVPRPLVVDACALLCNPGAETESERERDPELFPRYPKVNCKLQSDSDEHQAWVIASHCLKLCNQDLSIPSEVNCFALRSSLEANLGCYCEALTPLSPNTMRLHESWRLNYLVKELADDILTVILSSPLDTLILCEIHQELFNKVPIKGGKLYDQCKGSDAENITTPGREKREVEQPVDFTTVEQIEKEEESPDLPPTSSKVLPDDEDEIIDETTVTEDPEKTNEIPPPVSLVDKQIEKEETTDLPPTSSKVLPDNKDEIIDKPTVTEDPEKTDKIPPPVSLVDKQIEKEKPTDLPPTSSKVLPDNKDEIIDKPTVTEDPEKTDEVPTPVLSIDKQIEKEKTMDLPPTSSKVLPDNKGEIVDKPTVTEEPMKRTKRTKNPDVDEDSKRAKKAYEVYKKSCEKTCMAGKSTEFCNCDELYPNLYPLEMNGDPQMWIRE